MTRFQKNNLIIENAWIMYNLESRCFILRADPYAAHSLSRRFMVAPYVRVDEIRYCCRQSISDVGHPSGYQPNYHQTQNVPSRPVKPKCLLRDTKLRAAEDSSHTLTTTRYACIVTINRFSLSEAIPAIEEYACSNHTAHGHARAPFHARAVVPHVDVH